ncbi:Mss4-like protein [Podospora aff. communis PSN243]|uniref:Mss4-like protein n=1 Tax=Podospora aff. communis PSN243 TaxID=3040156 RepID=A0AAV9GC22_9PEZI|nr:Mss4-like protein [Podospora aff. communis PSN243]
MAARIDLSTPKQIKGGCLCGSIRYEVNFPPDHDFKNSFSTCQCTQCRKQTSSFFLTSHAVKPVSALRFTSPTTTLKDYEASSEAQRGFCTNCGSLIYWRPQGGDYTSFTVGTVDALYLWGEGADGVTVPKEGWGKVLASGEGDHWWTGNEIRGVTDSIPVAGCGRGRKNK